MNFSGITMNFGGINTTTYGSEPMDNELARVATLRRGVGGSELLFYPGTGTQYRDVQYLPL